MSILWPLLLQTLRTNQPFCPCDEHVVTELFNLHVWWVEGRQSEQVKVEVHVHVKTRIMTFAVLRQKKRSELTYLADELYVHFCCQDKSEIDYKEVFLKKKGFWLTFLFTGTDLVYKEVVSFVETAAAATGTVDAVE